MQSVDKDHFKLAYRDFALVYDEMMTGIDYPSWTNYILKLFRKYSTLGYDKVPLSVLDLACGTGSFLACMREKGWQATGIDQSLSMLAIANEKLNEAGADARLFEQDITMFSVGGKFPLVTCLCDGLNYILSPSHLQETLERVYEHLMPGGIFIADLNSAYKFNEILGDNTYSAVFENSAYIWSNSFDSQSKLCRMEVDFFHRQKGELFRHFKEVHWQRLYEPDEFSHLAKKAGFSEVKALKAFTLTSPTVKDERIFYLLSR